MHYMPLALPFLFAFFFLFALLVFLVEIGILEYAYHKIGIGRRHIFSLLLLSLLGSYVNIPVAELPSEHILSGSLGTLIGADLFNLDKIRGLGAPVASIGGAGTFDGIFLTGIVALLLASLAHRKNAKSQLGDQEQNQSVEA